MGNAFVIAGCLFECVIGCFIGCLFGILSGCSFFILDVIAKRLFGIFICGLVGTVLKGFFNRLHNVLCEVSVKDVVKFSGEITSDISGSGEFRFEVSFSFFIKNFVKRYPVFIGVSIIDSVKFSIGTHCVVSVYFEIEILSVFRTAAGIIGLSAVRLVVLFFVLCIVSAVALFFAIHFKFFSPCHDKAEDYANYHQ